MMMDLCVLFTTVCESMSERLFDKLMKTLKYHIDILKEFTDTFPSISAIRAFISVKQQENATNWGFRKQSLQASTGLLCTVYCRNPVSVLKKQVQLCSEDIIARYFGEKDHVTNPFNGAIGKHACKAVEQWIKESSDLSISWKSLNDDGIKSMVGCLKFFSDKSQIFFSDKSQISLFAGSQLFNAIHVTLLKFTEERKRKLIERGETVVAYFPGCFNLISERTDAQYRFTPTTKMPHMDNCMKALNNV